MKRPKPETLVDLHVYGGILIIVVGTSLAYGITTGAIAGGTLLYLLGMKVI